MKMQGFGLMLKAMGLDPAKIEEQLSAVVAMATAKVDGAMAQADARFGHVEHLIDALSVQVDALHGRLDTLSAQLDRLGGVGGIEEHQHVHPELAGLGADPAQEQAQGADSDGQGAQGGAP